MINIQKEKREKVLKFIENFQKSKDNFYIKYKFDNKDVSISKEELSLLNDERIINKIHNNIYHYAVNVVSVEDFYDYNILKSNMKRWKRILREFGYDISLYNIDLFIYMDLTSTCMNKSCIKYNVGKELESRFHIIKFIKELDDMLSRRDYIKIVKYSLMLCEPSLLEKLMYYVDLKDELESVYNIKLPQKINGKKIYNILKNKEKNSNSIE